MAARSRRESPRRARAKQPVLAGNLVARIRPERIREEWTRLRRCEDGRLIDTRRTDENILRGNAPEQGEVSFDVGRNKRDEIDDGVPSETSQGVSHGRDVADVRNDGVSAARRTRTPTPVEDVHLVAAGDREFRAGAGEDAGASEEEDSHGGGKPTKGASSVHMDPGHSGRAFPPLFDRSPCALRRLHAVSPIVAPRLCRESRRGPHGTDSALRARATEEEERGSDARALRLVAVVVIAQPAGSFVLRFPQRPGTEDPHGRRSPPSTSSSTRISDRTETVKIALQLENVRNVFVRVVFGRPPKPTAALRVIALRRDEYSQYDRKALGRYTSTLVFGPTLITSPGDEWGTHECQLHAYSHAISSLYVDLGWQPRWLAEGLAMMLSTVYYNAGTGEVEIGQHPPDFETLYDALEQEPDTIYWSDLWAWSHDEADDPEIVSRRYAVAWAVVHGLSDERPGAFVKYEEALEFGADPKEAWSTVFPDLDPHRLAWTIKNYLRLSRFKITRATIAPVPTSVGPGHALSDADVLGLRAMLYMGLGNGSGQSRADTLALARAALDASLREDDANYWAFWFEAPTFASFRRRTWLLGPWKATATIGERGYGTRALLVQTGRRHRPSGALCASRRPWALEWQSPSWTGRGSKAPRNIGARH